MAWFMMAQKGLSVGEVAFLERNGTVLPFIIGVTWL